MPSLPRPARPGGGPVLTWDHVVFAPVVVVVGSEGLLVDRATAAVLALARAEDAGVEVTELEAAAYQAGRLADVSSPSLFGESRAVVVHGLEAMSDAFLADALAYLESPPADAVLVLQHSGGQRGKKLLDAARASGAPTVACDPLKKDLEKVEFAKAEVVRSGGRIDSGGARALVDALGSDLRELASACSQIVADAQGPITGDVVARYYGGRVEVTAFRVADAAVAGEAGNAVALLRHAMAAGADAVPLVAALAMKLRTLAKVAGARGRGLDAHRDLGLAPWQVDRARRELARWTPESLAAAISAVAQADAEVKGAGRDPAFAVERAVLRIAEQAKR